MEAIKERFEKILDRIETSGKSATEWFGKYTHELLMNPDNWWEALAVCKYALDRKESQKETADFFRLIFEAYDCNVEVDLNEEEYTFWWEKVQETCDRVNAVIKELGYQPNRRAQSFATGATKTILFLAEMQHGVGFDNPHLFEIMAGVENALSEKGYGLIVQHSTALDLWQHFDELLQGSYVDGVILHASVVSKDVALCLAHTELPYIVVGAPDFSNQLCWIDTNNSVAGQIAVTHLWRNGYDRIAFIGGPKEDTISAHRLSGALATLNEKIPAGYLREGPPTSEGGAAAARALLELQTRPNAVICANQYIAFGCVNELKASGIRIPEDMAVITFDDFPFSKIIEPQLSVVNLDMYDMGEQAAKVVLRRIRTPQYLVQSQTTLPILIERQSTKKLP